MRWQFCGRRLPILNGCEQTKVAALRQAVQTLRQIHMSLPALPADKPDSPATPAVPVLPVDLIAEAASSFPHRPSWDEYFMATAVLISSRSNCERLHVGCVIVTGGERKNRLVAAGYNGFLPGTPHVSRVRDGHEQATVHAEQNAVADAARRGSSVEGCVAYVTHYPCINCAKILAAAGIAEIKYRSDYLNDPLVAPLLADAGVKVLKL
jgi:dCMP deaminase